MMGYYRKKPVVIEAWRNYEWQPPHPEWLSEAMAAGTVWYSGGEEQAYTIRTLEGDMRADYGDWIIKGVNGELYPCKDEIFAKTYDPA